MSLTTSVLSQTLQSITAIKIRELEKQRSSYEHRKRETLDTLEKAGTDQAARVSILLSGLQNLDLSSSEDNDLSNIHIWLAQSRYDASIPQTILQDFEKQLRLRLEFRSRKLDLANLYSRLLTDWLKPPGGAVGDSDPGESTQLDDSFEIVERDRLQQLREKFETVVFTPLETNEVEIENYLSGLFAGDKEAKALERLRREVEGHGESSLETSTPFNERTLRWCIKGLLHNDLLSDDKKAMLQEFLTDGVVLGEIVDVLNMRWADIKNWS